MTTRSSVDPGDIFIKNSTQGPKLTGSAWVRSWTIPINSGGIGTIRASEVSLLSGGVWEPRDADSGLKLLLPLQGSLSMTSGPIIQVGEFFAENWDSDLPFSVSNPSSDVAHFALIELDGSFNHPARIYPISFDEGWASMSFSDFNEENAFQPELKVHLGKLTGREEALLSLESPSIAMVLGGAFEYVNRLMEQGDGVWLNGPMQVELEALSTEGLILIAELGLKSGRSGDFS